MATPSILEIQRAISATGLPVTTSGPVVVKRAIKNTSTPSQHSFGNAMDYYPSGSDERTRARKGERVPSLEALYSFLTRQKSSGNLPLRAICYYRRGGCTTAHLDHLHVDADPRIRSESHLRQVQGSGSGGGGGGAVTSSYVSMSPSQLRQLDCGQYARDADLIVGLRNQFSDEQRDALIKRANECGQNNPLLPDFIEGPIESAGDTISSVGDFVGILASGELWVRVAFVLGGFVTAGAGVYFIAKEFGLPSVTSVAQTATGGAAGAVAKAVKG